MNQGRKETLNVRIISTVFTVLAIAIFKPFGLEMWQWQAYVHLLAMFTLGIISCTITEVFLKYVIGMPHSTEQGVSYIIRRNLWFQCINTPLVTLLICLYRHFVMSNYEGVQIPSNIFSLSNFIETLLIIAFLSFAIGLYWRFRYRNRYLAMELEETRMLNEKLRSLTLSPKGEQGQDTPNLYQNPSSTSKSNPSGDSVLLSGTTNETVTLQITNLLYIEAVGNYVKIYQLSNGQEQTNMLRATSKQIEDELGAYPMIVRCHRAFLVNLGQVEQFVSHSGSMQLIIKHSHNAIPVSRSNMAQVKKAIKGL